MLETFRSLYAPIAVEYQQAPPIHAASQNLITQKNLSPRHQRGCPSLIAATNSMQDFSTINKTNLQQKNESSVVATL